LIPAIVIDSAGHGAVFTPEIMTQGRGYPPESQTSRTWTPFGIALARLWRIRRARIPPAVESE